MRYWILTLTAFLAACNGGSGYSSSPATAADTTPPVISLTSDNPQVIEFGDPYTELGATATDNSDGDLSVSIVIDASSVYTSTPGDYLVTYDVNDAAGNGCNDRGTHGHRATASTGRNVGISRGRN